MINWYPHAKQIRFTWRISSLYLPWLNNSSLVMSSSCDRSNSFTWFCKSNNFSPLHYDLYEVFLAVHYLPFFFIITLHFLSLYQCECIDFTFSFISSTRNSSSNSLFPLNIKFVILLWVSLFSSFFVTVVLPFYLVS